MNIRAYNESIHAIWHQLLHRDQLHYRALKELYHLNGSQAIYGDYHPIEMVLKSMQLDVENAGEFHCLQVISDLKGMQNMINIRSDNAEPLYFLR